MRLREGCRRAREIETICTTFPLGDTKLCATLGMVGQKARSLDQFLKEPNE